MHHFKGEDHSTAKCFQKWTHWTSMAPLSSLSSKCVSSSSSPSRPPVLRFSTLFPPFLALVHSVSLFHTFHLMVVDMCLSNVCDSVFRALVSQLHLGQLSKLKQCDGLPSTPFYISHFDLFPVLLLSFHLCSYIFFCIRCQSVVAQGVSVFCWSVIFHLPLAVSLLSPQLFVSPLDSGRLIIFVEQQCAFVSSD